MNELGGKPFTILVVEDDEDDREILDEAFMMIGYAQEVKKFITPKNLFDYLQKLDPSLYPSLIVLDNQLGGMSASDVLDILKSNENYRPIPVVVYSTDVTSWKKAELTSKGAIDCLVKGSIMNEVVDTAKKLKELALSTHQPKD
jgi:CheY-like chemotaxis protein